MTCTASSSHDGLILAVNNAEETLQLILGTLSGKGASGPATSVRQLNAVGKAGEVLAPALADMLTECGATMADVARISCVRGPGSFTGMRISLAFVAGLAAAGGQPTAGIDHLPLLAASAPRSDAGTLAVVTHSRRRQVYVQAFQSADLTPLPPPLSLVLEEAAEVLAGLEGPVRLLGTGLRRNAEFFEDLAGANPALTLLDPTHDVPTPETLLAFARSAAYSQDAIEPLYLRGSDAEENLAHIASLRGLDPDKAKRMLDKARSKT